MLDSYFKSVANADDIEAIAHYFQSTPVRTSEAQGVKNKFMAWYQNYSASIFTKVATDESFLTASRYRDEFNRMNAVTPQQQVAVRTVQQYGLTRDEALGIPPNTLDLWSRTKRYGKWIAVGAGALGVGYIALQTKAAAGFLRRVITG